MAECTTPAQISEADYEAARAAGLLIVTVAEEVAAHKFAEAIRAPLVKTLRDMDGWLANTGHAETHPWRISIRAALAA